MSVGNTKTSGDCDDDSDDDDDNDADEDSDDDDDDDDNDGVLKDLSLLVCTFFEASCECC